MENLSNVDVQRMAALAVLRELYNSGLDLYDIVAEFVKNAICRRKLHSIELMELCQILKEEYGLFVVSSVVKKAASRINFLKVHKTNIEANGELDYQTVSDFVAKEEVEQKETYEILNQFIEYLKVVCKIALSVEDEDMAKRDFCRYIVEKNVKNENNIAYISSFILLHKSDVIFQQHLNQIKEGLVIYNGLSYTVDVEKVEVFDQEITFYLETEILFYAVGLNGELYKFLFDEFYRQVELTNEAYLRKKGRRIINLSYFEETKHEIERYFSTAESIVSGAQRLDRFKLAMTDIVNGCQTKSDIKEKEIAFWKKIESLGIIADPKDYDYNGDVKKYIITVPPEESPSDKDLDILQMLTKVNYLRRLCPKKYFKSCGRLLITGNGTTIDYAKRFIEPANVPLATTLGYVTNRLWFSLNKGMFIATNQLSINNIVTLAQISFSQKYNLSILSAYERAAEDVRDGRISPDEAMDKIVSFRESMIKPDDAIAVVENDDSYLAVFDGTAIEEAKAALTIERAQHKEQISLLEKNVNQSKDVIFHLLDEKNKEIERQYSEDIRDYQTQKVSFVRTYIIKEWIISSCVVLVCVVAGTLLAIMPFRKELEITLPLALICIVVVVSIIFDKLIRFIPSNWIKKSFVWLFSRNCRIKKKQEIASLFEVNNSRPCLHLLTYEDFIRQYQK